MPEPESGPLVAGAQIADGLRRLGLSARSGVMVHSSLRSLGRVEGGARTVLEALMAAVTPDGTLMMPSFNHGAPFAEGGCGFYDPAATPTTNGAIPDAFWRMPGVCRSLDPTHAFACWGRNARRYTALHHRTLTMGPESPLGLLGREGGCALLVGVTFRANTYHHVVEMTTGAPCLGRRTEAYPVRLPDGRMVQGRTWGWRDGGCPITDPARYQQVMEARGLIKEQAIGACRALLFRLSDCFQVIAELLANGMGSFPPCGRCPVRPRQGPRTVPSDWDDQEQCLKPDSPAWGY